VVHQREYRRELLGLYASPEWVQGPWRTAAAAISTAALVIGIAIRLLLALVNLEANDSHLNVIRAIAFEHRFLTPEQDWEGFQPKLYHTTVALVWRLLPTHDPYALIRAAQLVSCAAGILTLLVILYLLRYLGRMHDRTSHIGKRTLQLSGAIAFAAVALNPALAGISAQATNDAFVILFGSLALYAGVRVFAEGRGLDLAALVLWATLAGLSKGNGLVAIVAIAASFAIIAIVEPNAVRRRGAAIRGVIFVALVGLPVALIGPYYSYQHQYGTPFVTNWAPSPRPFFLHETFVERPGMTSVVYGLFTFHLVDLLRQPALGNPFDRKTYPRYRTSLWSMVYGQAHSAQLMGWPPSWKARSPLALQITRALILLGLVPTVLFTYGFVAMAREATLGRRARGRGLDAEADVWPATLLLLVVAVGYLIFIATYSIRFRDYSSMKTIFILPALPAFAAALDVGGARLLAWAKRGGSKARRGLGRTVIQAVVLAFALLLLGYVADLSVLAAQLADDRAAGVPPFEWRNVY
jgi:hypothetical protein